MPSSLIRNNAQVASPDLRKISRPSARLMLPGSIRQTVLVLFVLFLTM